MSTKVSKIKAAEKDLILKALAESAKQMPGTYPALNFVNELLTESEKLVIGRRILIAHMLLAGETYFEIQNKLSVSPNTINLTRKWLEKQMPDYDLVTKTEKSEADARSNKRKKKQSVVKKEYLDPLSFSGFRRRYPAHFLLFDLAETILKKFGN